MTGKGSETKLDPRSVDRKRAVRNDTVAVGDGGRRRSRLRGALRALGVTAAVLASTGPVAANAAAFHPKLLAAAGYGTAPIGFARTADGTLHVVYETNTAWGNAASGVGAVPISPSGHVGPAVQALTWTGITGGSPSGIPGLAVLPSGALEATFGGSPGGVDGPWGISSTDGGATWTAPVNIGSGTMQFGDSAVGIVISNGSPVLTAGCCGNIVIQQGFGPAAPTAQLTDTSDDAAGNTNVAVDASTGAVVTSWDSNAGAGGILLQQAAPTTGPVQRAPIPSQYGTGTPLALAGRDAGPGVFATYPADYGSTTHMRLLRYGGGSVAIGSVKGVHSQSWGAATGPNGRIWVTWYGQINGKGVMAFTRSNKAGTKFEPIQTHSFNWTSLFTLSGDGRLGPLDLLMSGMPAVKNGSAPNGIYYARVLPELTVTTSAKKLNSKTYKLDVSVTDAGDAIAGATVSAKGQSKSTNAKGEAKLTVSGTSGATVAVKVTAPTYSSQSASVTL